MKQITRTKRNEYKRNYTFKKKIYKLLNNNEILDITNFKFKNIFLNETTKEKYIKTIIKKNEIKDYILICKQTYKREFNEYILIYGFKPIKTLIKGVYFENIQQINILGINDTKSFNNFKKLIIKYQINDIKHKNNFKYKIKIIYSKSKN